VRSISILVWLCVIARLAKKLASQNKSLRCAIGDRTSGWSIFNPSRKVAEGFVAEDIGEQSPRFCAKDCVPCPKRSCKAGPLRWYLLDIDATHSLWPCGVNDPSVSWFEPGKTTRALLCRASNSQSSRIDAFLALRSARERLRYLAHSYRVGPTIRWAAEWARQSVCIRRNLYLNVHNRSQAYERYALDNHHHSR
jgi:hypothetical protein